MNIYRPTMFTTDRSTSIKTMIDGNIFVVAQLLYICDLSLIPFHDLLSFLCQLVIFFWFNLTFRRKNLPCYCKFCNREKSHFPVVVSN